MVGTIHQKLYISSVPHDMRLTALNLLPPNPPEKWCATLYDSAGKERVAPFYVDPNMNDGFLGTCTMFGAHPFPVNSDGARLEILWELTNEFSYDLKTSKIDSQVDLETNKIANEMDTQIDYVHPPNQDNSAEMTSTVDPNDPASWPTDPATLTMDSIARAFEVDGSTRLGRLLVETTRWGIIQCPD